MSGSETGTSEIISKIQKPRTQCESCGKMVLLSRLHLHRQIHSDVKSHICDHCGRAFSLKNYLTTHIRTQHRGLVRQKRFLCSTCSYSCFVKQKLKIHERIHTGEKPCVCQYCDKRFRESGSLTRHVRIYTGEKPYACDACGAAYATTQSLSHHYKRKHVPSPDGAPKSLIYRCDTCDKSFHKRLAYEKHRASHTGTAVAVLCRQPNCLFSYSDILQLKDHMSSVHPEKTYSCSICSKVFLNKHKFSDHKLTHDPNGGFQCSMCPKILSSKPSLIVHEKTHTRETPYECSVCNAKLHSPYLINRHMRQHQPPAKKKRTGNRGGKSAEANGAQATAD